MELTGFTMSRLTAVVARFVLAWLWIFCFLLFALAELTAGGVCGLLFKEVTGRSFAGSLSFNELCGLFEYLCFYHPVNVIVFHCPRDLE